MGKVIVIDECEWNARNSWKKDVQTRQNSAGKRELRHSCNNYNTYD